VADLYTRAVLRTGGFANYQSPFQSAALGFTEPLRFADSRTPGCHRLNRNQRIAIARLWNDPMTISDARNKEIAFGRIKRLANAGLLLEPFVMTLFKLLDDAVPSAPLKAFLTIPNGIGSFICNSEELYAQLPSARKSFFDSDVDPSDFGARLPNVTNPLAPVWSDKTVWPFEETIRPSVFYRSEQFNTVTRPLGWWKCTALSLRDSGEVCGFYPIWRSREAKDFSKADFAFLESSAPHIAHGLKTAMLIGARTSASEPELAQAPSYRTQFLPSSMWGTGVVLMDRAGGLVAMDPTAELVFSQIAELNGRPGKLDDYVRTGLDEVHRLTLSALDPNSAERPPVVRMLSHWSGAIAALRGTVAVGARGREFVTVLVERGETKELRRRRMMLRWGLSEREAEVLGFTAQGKTNPEIAIILGISPLTVKKHLERVFLSLGVETRTAAARILESDGQESASPD
jgi:DNA-binding CsgD family transcriptional regulator